MPTTWRRQLDAPIRPRPAKRKRRSTDSFRPWLLNRGAIGGDALRCYLSGATADGGSQPSPRNALGNYRSATEATRVGWIVITPLASLRVDQASRQNGVGAGAIITVTANKVRYRAPGSSTAGAAIRLNNGDTKTLPDGDDPSKWIRVTRISSNDFSGQASIEFVEQFHNLVGFDDVPTVDTVAGSDKYRAIYLRAAERCTSIKAYIETLGPSAVTSGDVLTSGGGSGELGGATDCYIGWPTSGWARIEDSGGTLREIVYYDSRTSSVLAVSGRGCLGTSPDDGAVDDVAYPVPGIRIAWEASSPLVGGAVQAIANQDTEPSGVSWSTARTLATGVSIGTLGPGEQGVLWIHRETVANSTAIALVTNKIHIEYDSYGVSYGEILAGCYRFENTGIEGYELHVGTAALPDLTEEPFETFSSLPHGSFSLGNGEHWCVVNYRNRYNLLSQYLNPTIIIYSPASAEGEQDAHPPSAPIAQKWAPAAGGTVYLEAVYYGQTDAESDRADTWRVYTSFDGTDPEPGVDTPYEEAMVFVDGSAFLDYTTAAQAHGADCRVIVIAYSSANDLESTNDTVSTTTADAVGPSLPPNGKIQWRGVVEWGPQIEIDSPRLAGRRVDNDPPRRRKRGKRKRRPE